MMGSPTRVSILCFAALLSACTPFPNTPTCVESSECGSGFRCESALCVPLEVDSGIPDVDELDSTVDMGVRDVDQGAATPDLGAARDATRSIEDAGTMADATMEGDASCTPAQLGDAAFIGTLERPSSSCRQLHTDYPCLPTGTYWMQYSPTILRPTLCEMDTLGGGWEAVPMPLQAEDRCTSAPPRALRPNEGCTAQSVFMMQNPAHVSVSLYSREMLGEIPFGPVGEILGIEMSCAPSGQGRFVCPTPDSTYINLTGDVFGQRRRDTRSLMGMRFTPADDARQMIQVLDQPLDTLTNVVLGFSYSCEPPAGLATGEQLAQLEVECRIRAHGGPGGGYLLIRPSCLVDAHCEGDFVCQGQICTPAPLEPSADAGMPVDGGVSPQDVGGQP